MYSGCNRIALESQHHIADALLLLLEDTPFEQISVTRLCREAGVSRQTFYTLFDSREDVVIFQLKSACCCKSRLHSALHSRDGFLFSMADYMVTNRGLLTLLYQNHLMHCFYDSQYEGFMECSSAGPGLSQRDQAYMADFLASALTSCARTYVSRGGQESVDELTHIIRDLMMGICFCSLFPT